MTNAKTPRTLSDFIALTPVRIFCSYGPCFTGYRFVRQNSKSITVAGQNGPHLRTATVAEIHTEPCRSCSDHPQSFFG